ncbi:MAG: glycosyltransferase family 4 protein, partial [Actinobacteria bacterium]|nr:glycosyltransferase family 4 protein [Actinomycetota bacterium]
MSNSTPPAPAPLRILLVEFNPSGGLFQFSFQLGEALAARGHRVELLTGPRPELSPGASGLVLRDVLPTWHAGAGTVQPRLARKLRRAARAARYVAAWLRVLARLREDGVDAVVWSEWRFALDGWFVAWAGRLARGPVLALVAHEPRPVAEQRRRGSLYKSGWLLRRSLASAFHRMDAVFVLGEQAAADVRRLWPGVRRVTVIPHGDEGALAGAEVPPPEEAPPSVLFFGTWTRYKGLELLLDAFALVRRAVPEATLVVAGAVGADVDVDALRGRAARIRGVRLCPGYVPLPEVAGLVGASRVVAVPYLRGAQSGVVHLAQTFGRPVVATAVGDIPAAVADEEGGIVVPPGDTRALATGLVRLLRDPREAGRLGR